MKLKKSVKRFLLLLAIIVIALVGFLTYSFITKESKVEEVKVLKEIKGYGYKLKDNKSDAYKKLFASLEKELGKSKVEEEKYVELISEMFILDFYSLEEKVAKTDVGGVDFVYQEVLEKDLKVMDSTATSLCRDNKIPLVVFGIDKPDNIVKIIQGERIGTLVK